MELIADECVDASVIDALREAGYTVMTVTDLAMRGSDDVPLLAEVKRRNLLFLTCDLDFGGYIFQRQLQTPSAGVVQYRIRSVYTDEEKSRIVVNAFRQFDTRMEGYFTTIDPDGVRQRPLPS